MVSLPQSFTINQFSCKQTNDTDSFDLQLSKSIWLTWNIPFDDYITIYFIELGIPYFSVNLRIITPHILCEWNIENYNSITVWNPPNLYQFLCIF